MSWGVCERWRWGVKLRKGPYRVSPSGGKRVAMAGERWDVPPWPEECYSPKSQTVVRENAGKNKRYQIKPSARSLRVRHDGARRGRRPDSPPAACSIISAGKTTALIAELFGITAIKPLRRPSRHCDASWRVVAARGGGGRGRGQQRTRSEA